MLVKIGSDTAHFEFVWWVGGGGGWWWWVVVVVCKPILVFSLSLDQAEQK